MRVGAFLTDEAHSVIRCADSFSRFFSALYCSYSNAARSRSRVCSRTKSSYPPGKSRIFPSSRYQIRVQSARSSARSWDTRMMVPGKPSSSPRSTRIPSRSRSVVGSSANSSPGRADRAEDIRFRVISPPDRPSRSFVARKRARVSGSSPAPALPCWRISAAVVRQRTIPSSGASSPESTRSRVVLPAPFSPIRPIRSPSYTASRSVFSISRSPKNRRRSVASSIILGIKNNSSRCRGGATRTYKKTFGIRVTQPPNGNKNDSPGPTAPERHAADYQLRILISRERPSFLRYAVIIFDSRLPVNPFPRKNPVLFPTFATRINKIGPECYLRLVDFPRFRTYNMFESVANVGIVSHPHSKETRNAREHD